MKLDHVHLTKLLIEFASVIAESDPAGLSRCAVEISSLLPSGTNYVSLLQGFLTEGSPPRGYDRTGDEPHPTLSDAMRLLLPINTGHRFDLCIDLLDTDQFVYSATPASVKRSRTLRRSRSSVPLPPQ